ncbi:MAG: formyltransferase family protein, partial [Phycisphaerae bacterium]|nr:formyltransferase family protein [Phycisphaerae bacterium]
PDRPAGRRRHLAPTPAGQWAQEAGLDVLKPERVNDPAVAAAVQAARAEAQVVVAFGQKIGDHLIAAPSLGAVATVNLHGSLLPAYRGAAPVNWALVGGESVTGNTVFSLVEEMDAGDILGRQEVAIDTQETAGELHDRLASSGPHLVLQVLDDLEHGRADPRPQDTVAISYAPKLSRADAWVDFSAPADRVRQRVHGLTPWPGVSCTWSPAGGGEERTLLLRRVRDLPGLAHEQSPGSLIGDGLVAAGQGAVQLLEVQPPGKRQMSWAEYAQGHRVGPEASFKSSQAKP